MNDVLWIDIKPSSDPALYTINVAAKNQLSDDFDLIVQQWEPGESEGFWDYTDQIVNDFKLESKKGYYLYSKEWHPVFTDTFLRLVFDEGYDNIVHSVEIISFHESLKITRNKVGNTGKRYKRQQNILGKTFVSSLVAIRAIRAITITNREFCGNEEIKELPPYPDWAFIPNRKLFIIFFPKPEDSPKWSALSWDLETDDEGFVIHRDSEGQNLPKRLHRIPSVYYKFIDGELVPNFGHIIVLHSSSWYEINHRKKIMQEAFRTKDIKFFTDVARIVCDNFINPDGSIYEHSLFQYQNRYNTININNIDFPQLILPLKYQKSGKLVNILYRLSENADWRPKITKKHAHFLSLLVKCPAIQKRDIYRYNFNIFINYSDKVTIKVIIDWIKEYFKKFPADFKLVSSMSFSEFIADISYSLFLILREAFIKVYVKRTDKNIKQLSKDELEGIGDITLDKVEELVPKLQSVFAVGIHEHLRLNIAYPMSKNMLMNIEEFFKNFFNYEYTFSYSNPYTAKPNIKCKEELGKVAANLAITYFVNFRSFKKDTSKQEREKRVSILLKSEFLPLGIYEDKADEIIDILKKYLSVKFDKTKQTKISYSNMITNYIDKVKKGTDEEKLRDIIFEPMKEAAEIAINLRHKMHEELNWDIHNQYEFFRDYPLLTQYIYDSMGYRNLDGTDYPNGLPSTINPRRIGDLERLKFGEFAMYKVGQARTERGQGTKYVVYFLAFCIGLGFAPALVAEGAGAAIIAATQGLGSMFANFLKNYGETKSAYSKAIVGFDSLENAQHKKVILYFDLVFDFMTASISTYMTFKPKAKNPLDWTSLDSLYGKVVNEEVRKQSSYLTSQVVSEAMQNVIKNKKWRERLHKGLQGLVRFTLDKGGKFLYKKGLKEIGLDKINLKNLLTILYFEYVIRIELGDEDDDPIFTRELEQILEVNLKEISEVCNEAKMI